MTTKLLLCDRGGNVAQLQLALRASGADLDIIVATESPRAVDLAARTQPAVVVTEIDLDGLSGGQLIRRFRGSARDTRIICWSGISSADTVAEMLGEGASAYLLKEDGPSSVARAIRAVLEGNVVLSPALALDLMGWVADAERSQRAVERALAEMTDRLEQLTTAKAEFLANVSHELRTPLTVAKGISHVLRHRSIREADRPRFLEEMESSLMKLTTLVDGMLTIAELDRGILSLELSEVDLAAILGRAADEVSGQYPEIIMERVVPTPLPAMADPVRIAEVVRQLLGNACRYSPPREVVQLRARTMEEGVVVSVTDRGQGIQRRVVSQAFNEPFSTGEETLRKERAGAGLGLHMARQLVLQHGGIIWADPLPGGGTRVSFCLPLDRGRTVTQPPVLPAEPLAHTNSAIASS
ncbi:MAG: hybrid sensor histidine kinase/response regulator [Actinomycetota bacterium]